MDFEQLRRAIEKAAANAPHQPTADSALEITVATLRALTKRLGPDFAREVRDEIRAKADRMASSHEVDMKADAVEVRALLDEAIWDELGATKASG